MNTNIFSQPAPEGLEHFSSIISNLGRTELSLMKLLVLHRTAGSLEVLKSVEFLAKELGVKERATHYVFKKLKQQRLITRRSANGPFAPCITVINSHQIVECINNPTISNQVTKPPRVKKNAQPLRFAFLKESSRFENVQFDMQQALHSSTAYWDYICKGFESIGFSAELTTTLQHRRLSNGSRGGVQSNRSRNVKLCDVANQAAFVAQYAHKETVEASFRVKSPVHPLLLIDDLDAASLDLLPDACAILETSPGNYQATLIAPRPLSSLEFLLVEDALLMMLGVGDKGAKGIHQLRRFPGSINNKPQLSSAFVTRVERVSERLTLTVTELNELIELGKKVRGFYEWDAKASAEAENDLSESRPTVENPSGLQTQSLSNQGGAIDQSASGREFGKAIELIRKGFDDSWIIQQIADSAGNRRKNGHPPGHQLHMVYAQGTVRRAREKYKSDAPRMNLAWMKKAHQSVSANQSTANEDKPEVNSK